VDALLDYARAHNLGRILVGRSARGLAGIGHRAFSQRLGARAPDVDIIAVAREKQPGRRWGGSNAVVPSRAPWSRYGYSTLVSVGITALVAPLGQYLDLVNSAMLFLLGVVVAAYRWGRGPAALAALLNVAAFDFFLVPPQFTFAVSDAQYVVVFAVLLIVGLVIGHLTAGLRYQVEVAHQRERRARSLSDMAGALSSALVEQQVIEISNKFVKASFGALTTLVLPDSSDKLQPPAAHEEMPAFDLAIAQWCYDRNLPAGTGTDTLPASPQFYLPLKAPMRVRGVLVVEPSDARQLLIPEQRRLLDTYAAVIAIALERIHFVAVAQDTLIRMESERLRNSLLAALSHDLRTPLTALVGMAETLALDLAAAESAHVDRAEVIRDQAQRTSRLVTNLLEMARLQSGEVKPRKDWQSLEELVGSAVKVVEPVLGDHSLALDLSADLPLVQCDGMLIERVLVNLLDNAAKYSPAGAVIGVRAAADESTLRVEVWDEGPGLPPGQEQAIFARFARGERESAVPGVGLGLAICEAIIQAHGGRIWAENRVPHGARFLFTLPLDRQPGVAAEAE
jgi:two-component system sensor histidine kinase KdpD